MKTEIRFQSVDGELSRSATSIRNFYLNLPRHARAISCRTI